MARYIEPAIHLEINLPATTRVLFLTLATLVVGLQLGILFLLTTYRYKEGKYLSNHLKRIKILYNFDRFVGHASQGVPDVPKYRLCHGVTKGPDERSENVTNLIVAILV